uniref:Uncharacterized protein n=1 Tax=Colobus angolensis palliatus TaxID=336983 RepID=A0A2K5K3L0_COLAP
MTPSPSRADLTGDGLLSQEKALGDLGHAGPGAAMALRRPGDRQCRGHVCLGSSTAVSSGMFASSKDTSNCNFSKHASWRCRPRVSFCCLSGWFSWSGLTLTCSLVPWLSGAWYGFVPDARPNPPASLQSLFGLMMTLE